jgi:lipid II:glycine glycyltransferase (peptidoglycan interpeptide bridge formation enzyme)
MAGVLGNPQWEAFAVAYAKNGNATKSALEAGFAAGKNNMSAAVRGSQLLKREEVRTRIDEIKQQLTKKALASAGVDRAWILQKLKENAEQALESRDRSAANRALELLGKEHGLFQDRKIIQIGPLEQLDAPRLQRLLLLAEAAEQGRLALPNARRANVDGSTTAIDIVGEIIEGEVIEEAMRTRDGPEEGDEDDFDVLG